MGLGHGMGGFLGCGTAGCRRLSFLSFSIDLQTPHLSPSRHVYRFFVPPSVYIPFIVQVCGGGGDVFLDGPYPCHVALSINHRDLNTLVGDSRFHQGR